MFCSSVRDLDAVAVEVEMFAVVVETKAVVVGSVDDVVEEEAEEEDWRLDLASSSRFSSSRSFWISFCWSSARLKNFLPPVSCARDFRFFSSSCCKRSIFGFA